MTLDEIKDSPKALKIYASRVKLQKENGNGYAAICPFHKDINPSFKIQQKEGRWLWKCFAGCGAGSVIDFYKKFYDETFRVGGKELTIPVIADLLGKELNTEWEKDKHDVEKTFKSVTTPEPKKVVTFEQYSICEDALRDNPVAKKFLEDRGITYETAKRLHFGFRKTLDFAPGSKEDWISIPCIEDMITSIEYRNIHEKTFMRQPGMDTRLFNTDTIDPLSPVFVTEGKFDAAILEQAGFHAVSLPNASWKLTPDMKDTLKNAGSIILAGDNDSPGQDAMMKLWAELGENTFLLKWPNGWKDANETFLKGSNFKALVEGLEKTAEYQPMQNFFSLVEHMESGNKQRLEDHPHRWHSPFPGVDSMVRVLPGGIIGITATNTGQGKTTFAMNNEIYEARKYKEIVINYSGELTPDEYSCLVAAHVLPGNRTKLQYLDYKVAAKKLGDVKFYTGYNPDLNTIGPVLDLIEKAIKRFGATRVILDHIHFFCLNEKNPVEVMAAAMQRIKSMCQKYGVIFIVLAQPRKAVQTFKGKPLHVTDVKGSEAVVSSSDAFLSIHREVAGIREANHDPYKKETIIQLLKGRSLGGGNSFTKLECWGEFASFREVINPETENSFNEPF